MSPTGHFAIGFVAKHYTPRTPVFILLIAAYLIDILYFSFIIIGLDTIDYSPWSHSLLMALTWSIVITLFTFLITKNFRLALILGIIVFSHWILDFLVWDNLSVAFNPTNKIGLGFYNLIGFDPSDIKFNSALIVATLTELGLLIFGVSIYIRVLKKLKSK